MKKKRVFEPFTSGQGDLMMDYLHKMALEGWKLKSGTRLLLNLEFEECQPQDLVFKWEPIDSERNGKKAHSIENIIIKKHEEEGWTYVGKCNQDMLIFSSPDELPFEVLGGEWGKMDRVFGKFKSLRKRAIIASIFLCGFLFSLLSGYFVEVASDAQFAYGVSGLFYLLQDNFDFPLMLLFADMLILQLIILVTSFLAEKERAFVEEKLAEGIEVYYGEEQSYKKARKLGIIINVVSFFIVAVAVFLMFQGVYLNGSVFEVLDMVFIFAMVGFILYTSHYFVKKYHWGKLLCFVFVFVCVLVFAGICVCFAISSIDEEEDSVLATIEKECEYPPSLFEMDVKDQDCYLETNKNIFGTYESVDIYYLEEEKEEEFCYNYYRYKVNGAWLTSILKKQLMEQAESYLVREKKRMPKGSTCYVIDWLDGNQEYYYYTDSIILFRENEILVFNCIKGPHSIDKILEKILQTPLRI